MRPEAQGLPLPALPPLTWIADAPTGSEAWRGRPVLVEFWDSTCLPCLRSLPWLRAWHRQYGACGLVVAGIHTPEFLFGRDESRVRTFAEEWQFEFPIALDPERQAWEIFHNRYWPSRYLFDAAHRLRYYHFGEGDEAGTEAALREVLGELESAPALPAPLLATAHAAPATELDPEGEPEMYLGLEHARPGNTEAAVAGETRNWVLPGRRELGQPYLEGEWRPELPFVETVSDRPASLHARVRAAAVHALLAFVGGESMALEVLLSGEPVPAGIRGVDLVETTAGRTVLEVREPRLQEIVREASAREWDLQLRAETPGLRAYTLAFESGPATVPPV